MLIQQNKANFRCRRLCKVSVIEKVLSWVVLAMGEINGTRVIEGAS